MNSIVNKPVPDHQIRAIRRYVVGDDGVQDLDRRAVVITDTATTECSEILANRALRNADLAARGITAYNSPESQRSGHGPGSEQRQSNTRRLCCLIF
jgi:hypothetical protein